MRLSTVWHRGVLLTTFLTLASVGVTPALAQLVEEENRDIPPREVRVAGPVSESRADVRQAAAAIVSLTNEFRERENRSPLQRESTLDETAKSFAEFMAETNKYGHTADGRRPSERAAAQGYEYCIVLENIAYQYRSTGFETEDLASRFVTGWENSPGHRENMVDSDVTQTGVAVARSDETGAYFAVQLFGRPKADRIVFEVVNRTRTATEYTLQVKDGETSFALPPRATRRHERCRPSRITFGDVESETAQTFQASSGTSFVVQSVTAERVEVAEREMAQQ